MKQWYEELCENYAVKYDNESFTEGTIGECDFIEKEIPALTRQLASSSTCRSGSSRGRNYNKQLKILDIGCGTGRHSIELSKRGYNVVGIDLSGSQLKRAKQKAAEQNLQINFQKHDARNLPFLHEFDLAIMLCEGGFPLMETDEMNFEILKNAAKALKSNGKLIFTTLNGLFPLFHSVKDFLNSANNEGNASYGNNSFNLMEFRDYNITYFEDDSGNKKELKSNERYYVPSEITWLLKSLNFKTIDIFGAKLGAFSRSDKLTTDDFEMLVVAEL